MSGRRALPAGGASARRRTGRGRSSTAWACYLAVALVAAITNFLNGRSARRVTFEKIMTSPSHTGGKTRPAIKLAICAIVKNEAPYLPEWIEHHKSIGFASILLYNDRSTDGTQCVLDAYAQRGDVTRIPGDTGSRYMEDAPNNPQQAAIFEACRRYLVDQERGRGEVGSTWMLTNDIDEFLWFDRALGNAMDTLTTMLSNASPRQLKSIVIPNCVFGPSGNEAFEPELLMERFVHRDSNIQCERGVKRGSWGMPGKSISQVSSMVIGQKITPHFHKVAETAVSRWSKVMQERIFSLQDVQAVGVYMRLAHYKTKSREEFYSRVCSSRYYSKYFDPSDGFNKKMMYPGCCSPASFFDYVDDQFTHEDRMMLPFAEDLQSKMSDAANLCKNHLGKALCPDSVMEMKNKEGLQNIESYIKASRRAKIGRYPPQHSDPSDDTRAPSHRSASGAEGANTTWSHPSSFGSRRTCDLSGLRVLATNVHFEGNLGDEMETTPMFRFLQQCDARVTARLGRWRGGQIHPNSARNVALVDHILLPSDGANASDYDVVVSAPGPTANFAADVVFGATLLDSDVRRNGIRPTTRLVVAREPLTYEAVLQSATNATRVFMGADLSFSFPASGAALEYWDGHFRGRGYAGSILVFSRSNNFGEGKGVSISGDGANATVHLQIRQSSGQSRSRTFPLQGVVFASSSIIEDGDHFQNLTKQYSTPADENEKSRFVVCEQVEQLWALVAMSKSVFTDRYHPGVAARIHDIPLKTIVYNTNQQQKLAGLTRLSNVTASEMKTLNDEAFQLLCDVLKAYNKPR